ncbi:hypothetical protein [Comamonas testosteroni]|uniref:hypothetical protein n=1 Tax=Comamonas testosteroni TaxID=285 RepID=UPI0015583BD4|nr:hypothetical protein [Comamonas testosteroni]
MVTIGGTTVTLVNNGNGTYSFQVPAGTTGGIVVTVPTHDDAVFEGSEKLTLEATLSGKTASGVDLPAGITDTGNAAIVDTESTDPGNPIRALTSDPGRVQPRQCQRRLRRQVRHHAGQGRRRRNHHHLQAGR